MRAHAVGLDFGTESVRAVVVDVGDGAVRGAAVQRYAHGVIADALPGGRVRLAPRWALQSSADWLEALGAVAPEAIRASGVDHASIAGLGFDFTSCTILPTTVDGTPLCELAAWRDRPHAWPTLWKHQAAEPYANRITELAITRGEPWLARYGGKLAPEWVLPKALAMLEEDGDAFAASAHVVEAADWIGWQLTGHLARNACAAGYKAGWSKRDGFPSPSFLAAIHPALADFYATRLAGAVLPPGARLGGLAPAWAERLGLAPGTPVAVPTIDAHAAVVGAGVRTPGTMLMVMGTSTCQMLLAERMVTVPGIAGVVEDGILPGLFGYEAGQPAVGDLFAWFVDRFAPGSSTSETWSARAAALPPGGHGLLALDWWNGNRSVLKNGDLAGVLVGLTLGTRPEDVYRALIEATAFGARVIVEAFVDAGLAVETIVCGGGLARDSALTQIYADAMGRVLTVTGAEQPSALGAAILGAAAGGVPLGEAIARMVPPPRAGAVPRAGHRARYEDLYRAWRRLHDRFGQDDDVMSTLARLRREALPPEAGDGGRGLKPPPPGTPDS